MREEMISFRTEVYFDYLNVKIIKMIHNSIKLNKYTLSVERSTRHEFFQEYYNPKSMNYDSINPYETKKVIFFYK